GLFVPELNHCEVINKNDKIGTIVNPLDGAILETIYAPSGGILFTLREYPIVYEGSLLARIFGNNDEKN
ncbi:MAG: succinylglutamate desuccinylase, partial [Sulfurimonas sp.]|nr:succinylglutamate desuccinylase [Sulfurimonas sp.]